MTKRNYISLLLLFVFSFILLHNVIPHNHHNEISELNIHNHNHHHSDHHHHHDNNNTQKEDQRNNDNDQSNDLFSHPKHIITTTEILFVSNKCSKRILNFSHYIPIKNFILKQITTSVKREPPNYRNVIPLFFYYSTYSHRGPPVFSV